jgi:hypothetical protein
MLWAIGGMVVGLLLGGFLVYLAIVRKFQQMMGSSFGLPAPKWWKFWK